jgi:hypothetical protein
VDSLLKGPEMALPKGITYEDSEGVIRNRTRICWWINPASFLQKNYFYNQKGYSRGFYSRRKLEEGITTMNQNALFSLAITGLLVMCKSLNRMFVV